MNNIRRKNRAIKMSLIEKNNKIIENTERVETLRLGNKRRFVFTHFPSDTIIIVGPAT